MIQRICIYKEIISILYFVHSFTALFHQLHQPIWQRQSKYKLQEENVDLFHLLSWIEIPLRSPDCIPMCSFNQQTCSELRLLWHCDMCWRNEMEMDAIHSNLYISFVNGNLSFMYFVQYHIIVFGMCIYI